MIFKTEHIVWYYMRYKHICMQGLISIFNHLFWITVYLCKTRKNMECHDPIPGMIRNSKLLEGQLKSRGSIRILAAVFPEIILL